jgi:N-acetylglutamate synthase-like GNAT family acetyltransferase
MTTQVSTPIVAGQCVTIRPIRLTDVEMEAEFVRQLSALTRHYRFFGGVKELSPDDLKRFCDVDGRHSMAFIATVQQNGKEKEIGVSRYAPNSKADVREMAVTIADDWQDKGLGLLLAKQLIASAKESGVKKIYSIELYGNAAMRELSAELGMNAVQDPQDARQVIYSLTL